MSMLMLRKLDHIEKLTEVAVETDFFLNTLYLLRMTRKVIGLL